MGVNAAKTTLNTTRAIVISNNEKALKGLGVKLKLELKLELELEFYLDIEDAKKISKK